jgi:hypothetical protein
MRNERREKIEENGRGQIGEEKGRAYYILKDSCFHLVRNLYLVSPMHKFFRPYVFQDGCCLHQLRDECPDDGGNKHLWTPVSLPGCTAQHPRRQPLSTSSVLQKLCDADESARCRGSEVRACSFHLADGLLDESSSWLDVKTGKRNTQRISLGNAVLKGWGVWVQGSWS